MSLNRPFKRNDGEKSGGGASTRNKYSGNQVDRQKHWSSLLADLEAKCSEPDEEPNLEKPPSAPEVRQNQPSASNHGATQEYETSNFSTNWNSRGSMMNSLYMQQLRGMNSLTPVIGSTMGQQQQKTVSPVALPPTLPLCEWVAHHKKNNSQPDLIHPGVGSRIDKRYLEDAARVALSLANKLESHCSDALVIDNVVVSDTTSGEVDFVNMSTPSDDSHSTHHGQRKAIYALGRIYYEIFTQGSCPPSSAEQKSTPASFSEPSSFDMALKITNDDDCNYGDTQIRRKQPRRLSGEKSHGHYTTLQIAGLPPSICRLVAHMLENGNGSGGLFCADQSVASLLDVVSDLQQMVDDPISFLHDSLVMRLEPIIPDKKLYGRIDELRQCLEMADAISQRECESAGMEHFQQPAIMISSFSGCGKSFLVHEVGIHLQKKGWQRLQCKFDQEVRPQPLSTITSAFDNLLVDIVCRLDNGGQQEVRTRIDNLLEDGDIDALCQLIPTLRQLVTLKDTCHPEPNDEILFNTRDAAASKCRLHRIFGLLVKALSVQKRPLFICMDDLQWADMASLELIKGILLSAEVDGASTTVNNEGSHMLFVGCFRSNEVAGSGPLATCIQRMKDCKTITLKEIHLEGLSSDDVNAMLSEALCYPRRLTRSLANMIHQKSTGNPLFVKEFLNSLATENLLRYSLSRHRWLWDEDVIEMKAVSNGVVDLLTSRLQRLPKGVLSALQVMSCFGHGVPSEILVHVRGVCGNLDIVSGLDLATKELLIRKADMRDRSVYSFVHDMVQYAVIEQQEQQERVHMLKEIADSLIARTYDGRRDAILFIIVDLINRVSPRNTPIAEDRVRYAKLNLLAGEKAIQTPDFPSAFEFIESGISFLADGHWEHEYDLSLALFKNAAGVMFSLGKSHLMTTRLNEVFDNARCYEDKLDSMSVLIQSLAMDGKAEMALDNSLMVLAYLGEPISNNLDEEAIQRELAETHKYVQQILPSSLDTIPAMKDPLKIKAMHFLNISLFPSHQQKSPFFAVISSRMVRLTLIHGLNVYSSRAMAALAYAYTTILRNYNEGYKLGKIALALNKSPKLVGDISLGVVNVVFAFKEPIQALLPIILENYKIALKCGTMGSACSNSTCYVMRAFLSGSPLASLNKEIVVFVRLMSRHNQIRSYLGLIPTSNAITNLSFETQHPFCDAVQGYEENEKNLSKAFEKKDISLCEIIIAIQIFEDFIFRRMDLAERSVRQYQVFFDLHDSILVQFVTIHRIFYSGLVAFHCFRETQDQFWMDRGRKAIKEMETWTEECKWNFENKLLLLSAEYHFSMGDFDKATDEYHLSITSAHAHRFIHEEAIANELAAHFQLERGRKSVSIRFMNQAVECYQTWGAAKKVKSLQVKMENNQDAVFHE